jgi:hypothetical protein
MIKRLPLLICKERDGHFDTLRFREKKKAKKK